MTDPVPNLPLLRKVLDHIDAEPESWDQMHWAIDYKAFFEDIQLNWTEEEIAEMRAEGTMPALDCGTAYCFAGHAAFLSGYDPTYENDGTGKWVVGPDGRRHRIELLAQELLGLTHEERTELFYGGNNRDRVQDVARQIAARVGEVL